MWKLALAVIFIASSLACDDTIVQTTSPAQIQISTDELDFGQITIGERSTRRFTINNLGQSTLILSQVTVAPGVFTLGAVPDEVLPQQDTTIEVHFAPQTATEEQDLVRIFSNAANSPEKQVALRGVGVPPANHPPIVSVALSPSAPTTIDELVATTTVSDPDGDPVQLRFSWTRDGVATNHASDAVTSAATRRDERWEVTVIPSDGEVDGTPAIDHVVVQNTPPVLASLALGPVPTLPSTTLSATPGSSIDADGDAITLRFRWTVDGVVVQEGSDTNLLPGHAARGQVVLVRGTPDDGTDEGPPVDSNAITIGNNPPSIASVEIQPNQGSVLTVFTCTPNGWQDPDGDPPGYTFEWFVNGGSVSHDPTLDATHFNRGSAIHCSVTPFDGHTSGASARSQTVVVGNAVPSISTVTITPPSPREADTLQANITGWIDPDGDASIYRYAWQIGGQVVGTSATLSGAFFDKGDIIHVTVTPEDGYEAGTPVSSAPVTVLNTPPTLASVSITPAQADATTDLQAALGSAADADGDNITFEYAWYEGGAALGQTGAVLTAGVLVRGDAAHVVVTPFDGEDYGTPVSSAVVTLHNTPPGAPVVEIQPANPNPGDALTCIATQPSSDSDGDAVQLSFSWTRDGLAAGSGSTVPASTTAANEVWTCTATPNDGIDDGPVGWDSVTIAASSAWLPMSTTGSPSPRDLHGAVWTGSEMIVYGGRQSAARNTGGRYDPVADTWMALPTDNAPEFHSWGGTNEVLVWTGSQMIAWNGYVGLGSPEGGVYSPTNNQWTPMSAVAEPGPRRLYSTVWTGTEMIVWGGCDQLSGTFGDGGLYNPASNTWRSISTTGAPSPRCQHSAIWTGSEMIVWGGMAAGQTNVSNGVRYDPVQDTWSPIGQSGAPTPRRRHSAVWTGSEMIVFGGSPAGNNGARYNPSTNTWTPLPASGAPTAFEYHTAVWTSTEMIVWGGNSPPINQGAKYDPSANSWTAIPSTGAPPARYLHTAVWTGTEMIIWGGATGTGQHWNSGARLIP